MAGESFGPYELRRLIGRGGMGEVFQAVDRRKNRGLVAVKRLPAGLAEDPGFQRRFLREAELVARLRDPHVIPVHDYGDVDGRPFLEMRLVDGTDLATSLERGGPLAPARVVNIVTQVASALDAAHQEGLVHRDVKPHNILLHRPDASAPAAGASDFVYLIDFGIAANLLSSRHSSSVVSGTAAYMAPERFRSGGDHRVDVYALGAVLHELLTGGPPFTGDFMQLMWAHANAGPPAASRSVNGLPDAFDEVIATAMAKDPERRQPTAAALALAARQALARAQAVPSSAPSSGPVRVLSPVDQVERSEVRAEGAGARPQAALPTEAPPLPGSPVSLESAPPATPTGEGHPEAGTDAVSTAPPRWSRTDVSAALVAVLGALILAAAVLVSTSAEPSGAATAPSPTSSPASSSPAPTSAAPVAGMPTTLLGFSSGIHNRSGNGPYTVGLYLTDGTVGQKVGDWRSGSSGCFFDLTLARSSGTSIDVQTTPAARNRCGDNPVIRITATSNNTLTAEFVDSSPRDTGTYSRQ